MRSERDWPGVVCSFILFIAVCVFLLINKNVAVVHTPGRSELGLLLFVIPGLISGSLAGNRSVLVPVVGAILAVPVCLVMIRCVIVMPRSVWQDLAWLSSAVFWCSLGALCLQFLRVLLTPKCGRH